MKNNAIILYPLGKKKTISLIPINLGQVHSGLKKKKFIYIVAGLRNKKKNWRHYFKLNFIVALVFFLHPLTPPSYFRLFVFVSLSIILKQQQIFIFIEMVQNPRSRLVRTLYVLFQYYNILFLPPPPPPPFLFFFFWPVHKICKLVTCHRTSLILSCTCQRIEDGGKRDRYCGSTFTSRFFLPFFFPCLVAKNWWALSQLRPILYSEHILA